MTPAELQNILADHKQWVLTNGAEGSRADLSGAYLYGANLGGADLSGAYLYGANLRGAYLYGANLRGANLCSANLYGADLRGVNLRGVNLYGADLGGANLSGVNLGGANLSGVNLRGADLGGANLSGVNLRGVNLSGVNLYGVNLRGVNLSKINPKALIIPDIDAQIACAIADNGNALEMSTWHTCGTTHCRAGWAITLAGDAGRELEKAYGPSAAGAFIYALSRPNKPVPDFHCDNDTAMESILNDALEASATK